jgi:hypothetical protein
MVKDGKYALWDVIDGIVHCYKGYKEDKLEMPIKITQVHNP